MFDVIGGEKAFGITSDYMATLELPEGVYILETPNSYIAVFNPDETMVKPYILECWDAPEAEEVLEEKWKAFKRQNLDDWEVKRLWN